jgi:phenylacetate-CoA ligase
MNYFGLLLNLYKLKRNTTKSREQIKNLQEQKLRKIIKYAYNNSEYYRRIFSNKGITEKQLDKMPLSEFPTIDKAVLIENFESLVTVSDVSQNELREFDNAENKDKKLFKGKYHIVHSSGSTGKPAYFVYDETAWDYMLCGMIRAALWNMSMFQIIKYLVKIPKIMYIAATDGRYGGAMAVGDGIEGVNGNQLFLDVNMPLNEWKKENRRI